MVPLALRVMKVLGLVAFFGCHTPLEGGGFEPFNPPAIYREWWSQLSRCAGVSGDFDDVTWIVASWLSLDGEEAYGMWASPNTIYLKRFYVTSQPAVKHEMLHELTDGELPHAAPAFRDCTRTTE